MEFYYHYTLFILFSYLLEVNGKNKSQKDKKIMPNEKKTILIFLGPPGSGKGTQADMVGEILKIPVISLGELLRHERDTNTALGKRASNTMARGEMVPDEIIETVLDKRLSLPDASRGYILDGYPRRQEQLELLLERFERSLKPIDQVIVMYIDLSDEVIKTRLGGRLVCDCGAAYHIEFNAPKKSGICDLCGNKLYQREDDDPAVVVNRLEKYHKITEPILNYLKDKYPFFSIDGSQPIKTVKANIIKKLNS